MEHFTMFKFVQALATALLFFTILGQPSQAALREGEREISLTRQEHRLVKAVNAYRRRHKLPELTVDPTLMRVARRAAPYFNHGIDGKWGWHRGRQAGLRGWASGDSAEGWSTPAEGG